jgi:hypothetical protein
MMSAKDVSMVLHVHMRALEITDPYSQDYYYHNYKLKEMERLSAAAAAGGGAGGGRGHALPLPVWAEHKEKAVGKKAELWNKFADNSKGWDEKNKVMGKTAKSNPHRPRPLLAVQSAAGGGGKDGGGKDGADGATGATGGGGGAALTATHEDLSDDEEEDEVFLGGGLASAAKAPFSSRAWGARRAVENAKVALLEIQEQRRVLGRQDRNDHPELQQAAIQTLNAKFGELQAAIGFSAENNYETLNDPKLLADVVATDKGKKLVAQVMQAIPSQALAMLPTTLRVVFSQPPVKKEDVEALPAGSAARYTKESAAAADDVIMAAAHAAVQETDPKAKPFTYAMAKVCIESVMVPHVKVREGSSAPAPSSHNLTYIYIQNGI